MIRPAALTFLEFLPTGQRYKKMLIPNNNLLAGSGAIFDPNILPARVKSVAGGTRLQAAASSV